MNGRRLRMALSGAFVCATAFTVAPAIAGTVFPGTVAPHVEITQRLGAPLPLDLQFTDSDNRVVRLGDFFAADGHGSPVVLVLGYYRCLRLCETVMEGAIDALASSGVPRSSYRIVAVSVDPAETAADASTRRQTDLAYADVAADRAAAMPASRHKSSRVLLPGDLSIGTPPRIADDGRLDLHTLVGDAVAIDTLAARVGFGFVSRAVSGTRRDDAAIAFDHAAGFIVATPDGRVSRYFLGVRHDPIAVRDALEDAHVETIGSLVNRLVLLCAHVDPTLGRWSQAVLIGLRVAGSALALSLLVWIWRQGRTVAIKAQP